MARDPFAPVVESSVPKWVWLVVGGFAVMLIGLGTTVALVLTKRPAVQAAKAGTLPPSTSTPATTPPEKPAEVATNDKPAAAAAEDKGDKSDKGDEPHKRRHKSSGSSSSKKPASDSKPADKPAAPAKPKKVMDQKDIDKLLGL
jgi:hypothetical protein